MKIDFVSDLHLDFWIKSKDTTTLKFKVQLEDFIKNILCPVASDFKPGEVLIIAGDLGHYNTQTKALLAELKKIYNEIIVVFGNHDMYLVSNGQISKYNSKSENRLIELKEICEELSVHYLDGNVVDILKNKKIDLNSLSKSKEYYKAKIGNKKFKNQEELYNFISNV